MKKIIFIFLFILTFFFCEAQKFAYVDTEYILNKIPDYSQAQDKLDAISLEFQKNIEQKYTEIDQLFKSYQEEQVLLTSEMKKKREAIIIEKEKEVKNIQQKYFGPEGELYKKRQELIKPIQQKIYDAIQLLAENNKYTVVFDSSSDLIMLYTNKNLDKSDEVLKIMGY
ncbi:MAG: OmpH family outer membrane protein [Bacteroidota bacterium]|nr:OmpH family outer membrane protein [Bacteroidota bacterium]